MCEKRYWKKMTLILFVVITSQIGLFMTNVWAVNSNTDSVNEASFLDACQRGDLDNVKRLLERGADPNTTNNTSTSALMYTVANNNEEIVKILLASKADPNKSDRNGTVPLMIAVMKDNINIVNLLLNAGADINYQAANDGLNSLMIAAAQGNTEIIELFISRGVIVDKKAKLGDTALNQAVYGSYADIINILAKAGADVNNKERMPLRLL
jgi:ankyrin repeat protein